MKRHGRKKPYTEIGVRRLPCSRCGQPASRQWNVCADGNLYRPLCVACDFKLNKMVLKWMNDPDFKAKAKKYKYKLLKSLITRRYLI